MTQQYPPQYPSPQEPYGQQPPAYGQQPPQWAPPQGHEPPAQQPVKKKRRKWPWIVAGVLLLLFVVIPALASGGKSSSSGTSTAAAPAASAPLPPAKAISARDWQLIAKDPASHTGERVIVYGQVTQFDAATGTDMFRGNVDGVEHQADGGFVDYTTNTVLDGDTAALRQVVQGDLFKAEATVTGAKSYDTQIGGSTTVPELTVTKIDVTGHAG